MVILHLPIVICRKPLLYISGFTSRRQNYLTTTKYYTRNKESLITGEVYVRIRQDRKNPNHHTISLMYVILIESTAYVILILHLAFIEIVLINQKPLKLALVHELGRSTVQPTHQHGDFQVPLYLRQFIAKEYFRILFQYKPILVPHWVKKPRFL